MRKTLVTISFSALLFGGMATAAVADPLPENCERVQGTVTCTTFEGPGKNQAGVGSETETETQGNTKNKSPEDQQDLDDTCETNPPKSQGAPDSCP